jgi:outer membrane beta-barrel protein
VRRLSALALLFVAAPALAAEPAAEPPPAPAATAAPADPAYWRARRHVGVIQKRRFPKAGKLELAFFAGVIPNDAFVIHVPGGVRAAYHTSEQVAWELSASVALDLDTSLRSFLEEEDADLSAQLRDRQRARVEGAVVLTPIYGKFAWMNRSVVHADLSFLAGLGAVYTTGDDIDAAEAVRPEIMAGASLRIFLSRGASLRFEYRQGAYLRADDGGVATPSELTIGLGILL